MLTIKSLPKDHWVNKTGTLGAIGGMGFLGVIMCNVGGLPGNVMGCYSANSLDESVCGHEHWHHHPSQPYRASLA